MSDTALKILENSQRHSAQVMGLISQQMQVGAQLNLQKEQWQANLAFKQAEFAQNSRYNEAKLKEAEFRNEILAKKWEAEKEIMPIRIEEAKINLEARKVDMERAAINGQAQNFAAITQPFDAIVAGKFAENQSPEYFYEYNDIKFGFESAIRKGAPWSDEVFKQKVDELNEKYAGVKPDTKAGYNGEVASIFSRLGDTNARARYEANANPKLMQSVTGIKAGLLSADDETYAKQLEKSSMFLSPEELVLFDIGRDEIKSYDNEINDIIKSNNALRTELAGDSENPVLLSMKEDNDKALSELYEKKKKRKAELLTGISYKPEEVESDEVNPAATNVEDINKELNSNGKKPVDPFDAAYANDTSVEAVVGKIASSLFVAVNKTGKDGKPLKVNILEGLNTENLVPGPRNNTWLSAAAQPAQNKLGAIKSTIISNTEILSNDQLIDLIRNPIIDDGKGGGILNGERIEVKSSQKNKSYIIGKKRFSDGPDHYIKHENDGLTSFRINSMEDLEKMIKRGSMTEGEARRNLIDIYSAIILAGIEQETAK
jgi:hypothetical protein